MRRLGWFFLLLGAPAFAQYTPSGAVFPSFTFGTVSADFIMASVGNPSTPTTALTQAISNSMSGCGSACTVSTGGGATQVTWDTTVTGFTVGSPVSGCANLGPVQLIGGTLYGAGALANDSFQFTTSTYTLHYFTLGYGIAPTNFTVGMCASFPTMAITGGSLADSGPLIKDLIGNYSIVQWYYNGTLVAVRLESGAHAVLHSQGYVLSLPGTYLIANNYTPATGSLYSGTYTSGGTITGTSGQTCNLTYIGGGGTGATATVALTGTNTIASGTAVTMTATGQSGYSSTSTSATLSSGTATCSGTATVVTVLGGLGTLSIHNATTGALVHQETVINYAGSTVQTFGIGNNEGVAVGPINFANVFAQWSAAQTDPFTNW